MAQDLSVSVRMYKVGELGDCFLLSFIKKNKAPEKNEGSNVLIDCGSFRNSDRSKARLEQIAADIQKTLGKKKLDVIVGTHQHNDHLSGFKHAHTTFKKIGAEQVWLSWLDDPDDLQASKIGTEYNNFLTNLRNISANLASQKAFAGVSEAKTIKKKMDSILGFYGITAMNARSRTEKFPPDVPAEALSLLRKLGNPSYLYPGQVFDLPGLPLNTVKVYVLGPPRDEKLLKDPNPNSRETYDHELALNNAQAEKMLLALDKMTATKRNTHDEQPYPFNEPDSSPDRFWLFDDVEKAYNSTKNKWRQIDNDWLKQAERLALWLDSYTNNSSLVLAFELVKANKVLLFPGDAQTGNWNSWRTVPWENVPKGFSWLNLMKKTVLYKVGHHGSHNATLVEGLEAMTHKELIAMIPVDKTDGNIKKENGWRMPANNLYERLKEKTKKRIIRMDEGVVDIKKKGVTGSWKKIHSKLPNDQKLFIEYEIKG